MHSVATHESTNKKHPRDCKGKLTQLQSRKYKRKIESRYQPKKKKEFERLTAENNYLKGIIERLIGRYLQVPATEIQKQKNFLSQSTSQDFHPNVGFKDEKTVFDFGGTDEELDDGLGLADLDVPLS